MKKVGLLLITAVFVFGSGFLKKSEDGNYSLDTAEAEKKANEAAATANAEVEKYAKQAGEITDAAIAKIKEAAAKISVPKEEVIADLDKTLDELKAKAAAMDPAKVVAYLDQYNNVFKDTQAKVADYTQQVKDLKWTQKFSKKGKELKADLEKYNDRFAGLKDQAEVYLAQLKSFGLDPAAFGLDLSAYGL